MPAYNNNCYDGRYVVALLMILKTGPILTNRRLSTLRNSGFISQHIISHNSE